MTQSLRLKDTFKKMLQDYAPSKVSVGVLKNAKIAIFDGLSGSGRNTIMQGLLKMGEYQYMVSDTTRRPRINNGIPEKNGVEYWFKTEEEVLEGLVNGQYIEAAIIHDQQVSGVSIKEVKRAAVVNKIAITDIQPDGVDNFKKYKPDVISIFITPPSFAVWLERLNARGAMGEEERHRRIESAIVEIKHALSSDFYYFLVNDQLEDSVKTADAICHGLARPDESAAQQAAQLLTEIEKYFARV